MKFLRLILLVSLITSCGVKDYLIQTKPNKEINEDYAPTKKDSKLEVTISCGKGSIDKLISEGWKVTKKYSEEKVCSWKSVPANNKCNIELDKGCKITKPDKIGEEIFYLLEKS